MPVAHVHILLWARRGRCCQLLSGLCRFCTLISTFSQGGLQFCFTLTIQSWQSGCHLLAHTPGSTSGGRSPLVNPTGSPQRLSCGRPRPAPGAARSKGRHARPRPARSSRPAERIRENGLPSANEDSGESFQARSGSTCTEAGKGCLKKSCSSARPGGGAGPGAARAERGRVRAAAQLGRENQPRARFVIGNVGGVSPPAIGWFFSSWR